MSYELVKRKIWINSLGMVDNNSKRLCVVDSIF